MLLANFNGKEHLRHRAVSLRQHGFLVIVVIGAQFGDNRPLDEAKRQTLAHNSPRLVDLIDANQAFVTELASPSAECITWSQREHLVNIIQPRDCNSKLLEFLTRRSVTHFNNFIKVLSKYQAHLVSLLVTEGGEAIITDL